MPYLIDGNNLLGRAGLDRESSEAKRSLVRKLAALVRVRSTSIICIFDGPDPGNFARSLGQVTVIFSGARSADDLIAERASRGQGWKVVTSDQQLAARVAGRRVSILDAREFLAELDSLPVDREKGDEGDWQAWFNDPKNRNI